jgi:hypothetical protein
MIVFFGMAALGKGGGSASHFSVNRAYGATFFQLSSTRMRQS